MKRILFATLLFGVALMGSAKNPKNITIDQLNVVNQDGRLAISFRALCPKHSITANDKLTLVPVLYNGVESLDLPAIEFAGRRAEIMAFRHGELPPPMSILASRGQAVDYSSAVPYAGWMNGAWLRLDRRLDGCARSAILPAILLAENLKLVADPVVFRPQLAYIVPEAEAVKKRSEQGSAHLSFEVGRSVILPDFGSNTAELAQIAQTIDLVHKDKYAVLRSISLWGTCSPEGSLASNTVLAQDRTTAVKAFIQSRYGFSSSIFFLSSLPEDWPALLQAVQDDEQVPMREGVLSIIRSQAAPDAKDRQLAALGGGVPYRYLLKNLYPSLRRVNYTIAYDVPGFDLAESKEVLQTRPGNLSLNEMYLIAQSYKQGSPNFNDLFMTAAKIFPRDAVANINAATAAIGSGDLALAKSYLARVKVNEIPEYQNTAGVIMTLEGDYATAAALFDAASKNGLRVAADNLAQVAQMNK